MKFDGIGLVQTVLSVIYIQINKKGRYLQIIKNQKAHCVGINLGTYIAQLIKGGIPDISFFHYFIIIY